MAFEEIAAEKIVSRHPDPDESPDGAEVEVSPEPA